MGQRLEAVESKAFLEDGEKKKKNPNTTFMQKGEGVARAILLGDPKGTRWGCICKGRDGPEMRLWTLPPK